MLYVGYISIELRKKFFLSVRKSLNIKWSYMLPVWPWLLSASFSIYKTVIIPVIMKIKINYVKCLVFNKNYSLLSFYALPWQALTTYIFWPIVEFSWKSKSTSMSKLQVVMHQVIPPTTCKTQRKYVFSLSGMGIRSRR